MPGVTAPIDFGPDALADLHARTEYEAWLLEAIYAITDQRLAVEHVDELIYEPSGAPPTQTIYASGSVNIGDWRPEFLRVGAPLVFVTAFKLLDMILEWVLKANGRRPTSRFVQKMAALKGPIRFPAQIDSRPWLRERLVGLYEQLEPLRGTIIHDRHFKSTNGGLEVSSSKGGVVGPIVNLGSEDLRNMALVLVSLLRHLEGTWAMDEFHEKRMRHALDQLAQFHLCSSLGQKAPGFMNVRVYVPEGTSVECDLAKIRRDVEAKRPKEDVLFDLRVVVVALDRSRSQAFLIPWAELQDEGPILARSSAELQPYEVEPPEGLNLAKLASALAERGPLAL